MLTRLVSALKEGNVPPTCSLGWVRLSLMGRVRFPLSVATLPQRSHSLSSAC